MKIKWDEVGTREYETGVDCGVVYPAVNNAYPQGVAWNGLSSVSESPSGGEETTVWADNMKYVSMTSAEEFGGTVEAYMYPDEFAQCDGSAEVADGVYVEQQVRKSFGLSYRTIIGNDTEGDEYGEKIHLVYGAKASPSEKSRSTVNDSPEATSLSWEFKTTPVVVSAVNPATGKPYKPVSHLVIDSTKVNATKYTQFKNILYGTDGTYVETEDTSFSSSKTYYELVNGAYVETTDVTMNSEKTYYEQTAAPTTPRLPLPDEVINHFKSVG